MCISATARPNIPPYSYGSWLNEDFAGFQNWINDVLYRINNSREHQNYWDPCPAMYKEAMSKISDACSFPNKLQ